jgi:LCP family protein required for cell wall assembly
LTWAAIAVFVVAGSLFIGLLGFVGVRLFGHRPDQEAAALVATPTVLRTPATLAPTPTVGLDIQPWDGKERFTVLLMGLDKRPNETGTAFRTDSMILVSLDPVTHSVGILSVPRDLYVEIPRDTVVRAYYGLQRVNTGYYLGETVQPGYGPKLAMQTVQYNLGVRVNDYIVYDFEAVTAIVDAVGGIDITVPRDIVDPIYPDMYGGYDPLYIKAGLQHMDGAMALKYARTRHDSSDIDRAERQQQIIYAMRDKVLNLNMLPALVVGAPGLWSQLSRHVKSGLTLDQIIRLVLYAKDIPKESIRHGVIDYQYVQPVTWNGAAVLVPNRYSIGPLLVQVFGANYNQ